MTNLAIFGGSFDPPHKGHKMIVDELNKLDFIDCIIVMPTFLNPLKAKPFFTPLARFKCLQDIIIDAPKAHISTFEINQKHTNYTIDSINYCRKKYNPRDIFIVVGADILSELLRWHRIKELESQVKFIVASRDNIEIPKNMLRLQIHCEYKSRDIRAGIQNFIEKGMDSRIESALLPTTLQYIKATMNTTQTAHDTQERIDKITRILDDKKAQDIAIFDLSNCNYITQHVIIATSLIDKHGFAMLDTLKTELKSSGEVFYATDEENGDWIIADLGDIMIHLFTENHRKKFNLEEFLTNYKKQENM